MAAITDIVNNKDGVATELKIQDMPGMSNIIKEKSKKLARTTLMDSTLLKNGINKALLAFLYFIMDADSHLTFSLFKSDVSFITVIATNTGKSFTIDDMKKAKLNIDVIKTYNEQLVFDKKSLLSIVLKNNNIKDVSTTVNIDTKDGFDANSALLSAVTDMLGIPKIKLDQAEILKIAKATSKSMEKEPVDPSVIKKMSTKSALNAKKKEVAGLSSGTYF